MRSLSEGARKLRVVLVAATVTTALIGAGPAAAVAARTPGQPVAPLPQVNQSVNGGDNTSLGLVPATRELGRPNAGVVPTVGRADAKADDGAIVAYESRVNSRTVDLMVNSPALAGAAPVRVLLPAAWSASPTRTFPTLVLLPGASEKADYQSWSLYSRVVSTTAGSNALVVMPSVGSTGIGVDWTQAGRGYRYATFLTKELPQLLARGYRASGKSAIAGASTGGYSAIALAASNPRTYTSAASFSGLVNSSAPIIRELITGILLRENLNPFSLWGDPYFGIFTWLSNDPTLHPGGLRGTAVHLTSGNGAPGPLDPPGAEFGAYEVATIAASQGLVASAKFSGVSLTTDFYGPGTHSWPYWDREFARWWPHVKAALGA